MPHGKFEGFKAFAAILSGLGGVAALLTAVYPYVFGNSDDPNNAVTHNIPAPAPTISDDTPNPIATEIAGLQIVCDFPLDITNLGAVRLKVSRRNQSVAWTGVHEKMEHFAASSGSVGAALECQDLASKSVIRVQREANMLIDERNCTKIVSRFGALGAKPEIRVSHYCINGIGNWKLKLD